MHAGCRLVTGFSLVRAVISSAGTSPGLSYEGFRGKAVHAKQFATICCEPHSGSTPGKMLASLMHRLLQTDCEQICGQCQVIVDCEPSEYPDYSTCSVRSLIGGRYDLYPDLPGLAASADKGCQFCSCLRSMIRRHWQGGANVVERLALTDFFYYRDEDGCHCLEVLVKSPVTGQERLLLFFLARNDETDDPRVLLQDIGSDSNLGFAKRELLRCSEEHEQCKPRWGPLPSRLLDVHSDAATSDIRLVISDSLEPQVRYAALSYCWGDTQSHAPLITTAATLGERMTRISDHILPTTIRDAVTITRKLGLRYLWVDALCIIQGDLQDWEKQSVNLASIYGRAFVTIAATQATHSHMGFLPSEPRFNWIEATSNRIEGRTKQFLACPFDGYSSTELRVRRLSHAVWIQDIRDSIWSTRAWTYQEQRFSNRVLYFGKYLTFSCKHHYADEITQKPNLLTSSDDTDGTSRSRDDALRQWATAVYEYSRRHITNPTDALPAISAIAHDMHDSDSLKDHSYYAGLFGRDIIDQLLWTLYFAKPHQPGLDDPVSNQLIGGSARSTTLAASAYVAPSWSWASQMKPMLSLVATSSNNDTISISRVIDIKTILIGDDPMGRVSDGYIHLNGPVKWLHKSPSRFWERPGAIIDNQRPLPLWIDEDASKFCAILLRTSAEGGRYPDALDPETHVFDSRSYGQRLRSIEGLLLKRTSAAPDGTQRFVRVGAFYAPAYNPFYNPTGPYVADFFDNCPRMDVIII